MIHVGNCLDILPTFDARIAHTCVTSPPYFGLRDYGCEGQIGLEATPAEFVDAMVRVFAEVRRVLRDDGTVWLNLGDSYAGSGRGGYAGNKSTLQGTTEGQDNSRTAREVSAAKRMNCPTVTGDRMRGLKPKDLIGIPWRVAFALQEDGWYLRQDIIWSKPNPMPESVTDRCTKAHEYLFLLSKSANYHFDAEAISEPLASSSIERLSQPNIEGQIESDRVPGKTNGTMKAVAKGNRKTFRGGWVYTQGRSFDNDAEPCNDSVGNQPNEKGTRNRRSVWTVATMPFKEAHFATFPEKLIEPCILAGSPVGGLVLDPFMGAGTTARVAQRLGRNYLGCELNTEYAAMANTRVAGTSMGLGF